jgi:hypothetical protein
MKSVVLFVFILLLFPVYTGNASWYLSEINSKLIYGQLETESLSFEAFNLALQGFLKLKDSLQLKKNVISVVDFSQPSSQKRFYLIDIETKKILFQDYVAHGRNTGVLNASNFSNKRNSHKSSLGFYKTAETYCGKHGLSLRLDGLEQGINNLARSRTIVIHTADYASEEFVKKWGRLGRSYGCPTLPSENYTEIIELIKEGSLLFVYFPADNYLQTSKVLN